jgi:hypothetical protein
MHCWQLGVFFGLGHGYLLTTLGFGGGLLEPLGNVLGSEPWAFFIHNV